MHGRPRCPGVYGSHTITEPCISSVYTYDVPAPTLIQNPGNNERSQIRLDINCAHRVCCCSCFHHLPLSSWGWGNRLPAYPDPPMRYARYTIQEPTWTLVQVQVAVKRCLSSATDYERWLARICRLTILSVHHKFSSRRSYSIPAAEELSSSLVSITQYRMYEMWTVKM